MQICSTGKKELTEAGELRGFAAVLWTDQGDAAAKVDEDAELCCGGGGGGARAARKQREEEDD